MVELRKRPQLVLIASHGEWMGRSVESVLELNGYSVLRVDGGRRALELARGSSPDALILDTSLPEIDGIEVCRGLVDDPLFDHSTPIFMTSTAPVSNRVRLEAYEAGAWDFCAQPLDVETLLFKLRTYLRARRRAEAAQSISLIDPLTGLYSAFGLRHWAETLGARASRNHEPFACVAVSSLGSAADARTTKSSSARLNYLADVCRAHARKSDVIGYVGESRFAILAPDTDAPGARRLVDRLQDAIEESAPKAADVEGRHPALHAGFFAASDFSAVNVNAAEVVRRAETALQYALMGGKEGTLSFDELPGHTAS
jgi:PleD family two-component response regulator